MLPVLGGWHIWLRLWSCTTLSCAEQPISEGDAHQQIQDCSLNWLLADCQLPLNPAKPFFWALSLHTACYILFLSPSVLQTPDLHLLLHFTAFFLAKLLYLFGFQQTTTSTLHTPVLTPTSSLKAFPQLVSPSTSWIASHRLSPPPGLAATQKVTPEVHME